MVVVVVVVAAVAAVAAVASALEPRGGLALKFPEINSLLAGGGCCGAGGLLVGGVAVPVR